MSERVRPEAGVPTVRIASEVYPDRGVPLDDPAEVFHEASKLHPTVGGHEVRTQSLLRSKALRFSAARAVRRSTNLPLLPLPAPLRLELALTDALGRRASERGFAGGPITVTQLSTLLHAAYGVTDRCEAELEPGRLVRLRTVPSGGALYPLELYVHAQAVAGLPSGLYHFDPSRHVLEAISAASRLDAEAILVDPAAAAGAAALLVLVGVFWRSRFKYGLRGYRFTLLEAGHAAQNLLLAATALDLASLPLGGFFDSIIDDELELDGVEESSLYALAVGGRTAAP